MAGDVDDVVGARHDEHVAVLVDKTRVCSLIVAGEFREIGFDETLVGVPKGRKRSRRQRQLDHECAYLAGFHGLAVLVEHLHIHAGRRFCRGSLLHGQLLDAHAVGADRPAGLGLPPVIDDRHAELLLGPREGIGIGALAGKKKRAETTEVVLADELSLRVFLLDGAERGRRGEHRRYLVLGDDPPEGAGIGRAHGLAFVENGRVAVEQRRINDIGVADDPTHVGSSPIHLPGLDVVDVLHGPVERDGVPAVVAHDALGLTGRSRRVKNVERIGGCHGYAVVGRSGIHLRLPVEIAARVQLCALLRTLHDDALVRLVLGEVDGLVEQRLVLDDAPRLDPAGRRDDHLGACIVDAHGELVGGETTENDRVHGAEPRAREHRDHGLRNHGHVDDDAIAPADSLGGQHTGKSRHLVEKLPVGERLDSVGDGAVVDERRLIAAAVVHVHVEGVVAGVELGAGEPAVERLVARIEHLVPGLVPVHVPGGLRPECLAVFDGARVYLSVATRHGSSPTFVT